MNDRELEILSDWLLDLRHRLSIVIHGDYPPMIRRLAELMDRVAEKAWMRVDDRRDQLEAEGTAA